MESLSQAAKVRLVVAVLLVAALAAAVVIATSGGSSGPSGSAEDQIRAAVQDFNDALQSHDIKQACEDAYPISATTDPKNLQPLTAEQLQKCQDNFQQKNRPIPEVTVGKITVEGLHATVAVSSGKGSDSGNVEMIKVGDDWKVAIPDLTPPGATGSAAPGAAPVTPGATN